MDGKWLTPTRKAYVYRGHSGWTVTLVFAAATSEGWDADHHFGFKSFTAAVEAVPHLWRR